MNTHEANESVRVVRMSHEFDHEMKERFERLHPRCNSMDMFAAGMLMEIQCCSRGEHVVLVPEQKPRAELNPVDALMPIRGMNLTPEQADEMIAVIRTRVRVPSDG